MRPDSPIGGRVRSLAARGALALDDPRAAAGHFNWLIMSAPLNRAMLLGSLEGRADLDAIATDGVAAFLAAYGPREPQLNQVRGVALRGKAPAAKPRCELPM